MSGPLIPEEPQAKALARTEEEPFKVREDALVEAATNFDEKRLAFQLASQVRQTDMIRRAAAAVAATSWGAKIDPVARAAVSRYMLELGADPLRHCYILGGTIYLNAEFYRELVAANPDFLMDDVEFIHDDQRAPTEERERRGKLRVKHGVPENAPGAAVVTLHYRSRGPFVGVNWAGAKDTDPVGKQDPTKTAHTRAYRKAALKAEPSWFRTHPKLKEASEIVVERKEPAAIADATGDSGDDTGPAQRPGLMARIKEKLSGGEKAG